MSGNKKNATIIIKRKPQPLAKMVAVNVLIIFPAAVGVFFGNEPMQWIGFVWSLVFALVVARDIVISADPITIEEARERLDAWERDQ